MDKLAKGLCFPIQKVAVVVIKVRHILYPAVPPPVKRGSYAAIVTAARIHGKPKKVFRRDAGSQGGSGPVSAIALAKPLR